MSLADYANLKATVINFSGRDDLSDKMDDFILLAEESIYFNDVAPLRIRQFETVTTLVTVADSDTVALPADFLSARKLNIEAGGGECAITLVAPQAQKLGNASGIPKQASVVGTNLVFDRKADGAYTINLIYYAKPTALSSSNTTNSVLTNHPSIYLNGCLSEVYDYSGEIDRMEHYHSRMIRSIKGAIRGDRDALHTPSAQVRVKGSTP